MDKPDLIPYIEGLRTHTEQLVTTLPGKLKKMPTMPLKETVARNIFEDNMQKLLQYLKQVEKACERAKNQQARMQIQDWRAKLKSMIDLAYKRPDMFVRDHAHHIGSSPVRVYAVGEDAGGQFQAMTTSHGLTTSVNGNNLLPLPDNAAGDEAPEGRHELLNNQVTAPSPTGASDATGTNKAPGFLDQVQPMVSIGSPESGEITFAPSQGSLSNLFTFGSNPKTSKDDGSSETCSTPTNPQEATSLIKEDVVKTQAGEVSAVAGHIAEYLSEQEKVEPETSEQVAVKPATLEQDHLQQTGVQECGYGPAESATENEYTLGHVFVWSPDHAPPNGDEGDVAAEQPVEIDEQVPTDMTVDPSASSGLQSSTEPAAPSAFTSATEEYTLGHVFVFSPDQAPANGDDEVVQAEVAPKTETEASVEHDVVSASDIKLENLKVRAVEPSVHSVIVATTETLGASPFTKHDSDYTLGHVFVFFPDHAPPNGDEEVVAVDSLFDTETEAHIELEMGALVDVPFESPTDCATEAFIDTTDETTTKPPHVPLPISTEPDHSLGLAFVISPDQPRLHGEDVEIEAAVPYGNACCNDEQHQVDDASDMDSLFDPGDASDYLAAALAENWLLSEDEDLAEETPIVKHNAVSDAGDAIGQGAVSDTEDSLIIITKEEPCNPVEEVLIAGDITAKETQARTASGAEENTLGHVFVWSALQAPPDRDTVSTSFPVPVENTIEDESTLLDDQTPKGDTFKEVVTEEVVISGTGIANDEVNTVTVEVETESLVNSPPVAKAFEKIGEEVVEEILDESFKELVEKSVEKSREKDFEIAVENSEHIIEFPKERVQTSPTFVPVGRCLTRVLAGITTASVVVGLKSPVTAALIMYAGIAYAKYRLNR